MTPITEAIAALQAVARDTIDIEGLGVEWTGLAAVLTFDDGDDGPETVLFLQERVNGVTVWGSVDGRDEWSEEEMAAYLAR